MSKTTDQQQSPSSQSGWKNRIVRREHVDPEQLLGHPDNWRRHGGEQHEAAAAVINATGWVRDVIVNERTGYVVDGHMRVALAMRENQATVPVTFVDLSPAEEALVLATFDPIADLAITDTGKLRALRGDIEMDEALEALVTSALARAGDPDDLPTGHEEKRGREATMDAYLHGDARQIHLPLLAAEYQHVSSALERVRALSGAERNVEMLFWLLDRDAEATGTPWRKETGDE